MKTPLKWLWILLSVLFWLGIWQLGSMYVGYEILFPSPLRTLSTLKSLMHTKDFYYPVLGSLSRIAVGFIAALVSGVVFASLARSLTPFRMLIAPLMSVIKATPVASFVILALIWISSKNLSVLMSYLIVLPAVYSNFLEGLDRADKKLLEMAHVFKISHFNRIKAIFWPAAFPYLLTSLRLSLGMCWKAGVAAEVIAQPMNSIGAELYSTKISFSTPEMFAWTIAIIAISVALEKLMLLVVKLASRRLYDTNK